MPTEPNSDLEIFTDLISGDIGWANGVVSNFRRIGRVGFQLSVISRSLTEPPTSDTDGNRYIPGAASTGAWAGHDDEVAVWDDDAGVYVFYPPSTGWVAYIEDEGVLSVYREDSALWSAGISI